jgi:small subunit ribosomal protein S2
VVGILDTDCDPTLVDIVIPGNDDALKSVRLLIDRLSTSVEEGSANRREQVAAVGQTDKAAEGAAPSDEPRPTRTQRASDLRPRPPSRPSASAAASEESDPAKSPLPAGLAGADEAGD